MKELSFRSISKGSLIVFVFYVCWFKYPFGNNPLILYGTAFVSCIFMLIDLCITRRELVGYFPIGVLINLFMCCYSIIIGCFIAIDTSLLFKQTTTYFAFTMICIACCYVSNEEKNMEWLIKTFIIVAFVCSLQMIFAGYYRSGYGYTLSENNNPNTLGLVLDIGIFGVAFCCKRTIKSIMLHIVLALLYIYCIVLCGSRKCLIAAVVLMILWLFSLLKDICNTLEREKKVGAILLIAITILIIILFINNEYAGSESYRRMMLLGTSEEGSSVVRIGLYKSALKTFLEHPFFGVGFFQFAFYNPFGGYAHSTYAEAISCWGFIGTSIYFSVFLKAILTSLWILLQKTRNYRDFIVIALLVSELFLGVGQIFYYEPEHMLSLTIIFWYLDNVITENVNHRRPYKIGNKYIKNGLFVVG